MKICTWNISSQKGVSIWELLIAIVVIGAVFAFAYPAYRVATIKAFQSDARINLINLDRLQQNYKFEHDHFASNLDLLNFEPSNGNHYRYRVLSADAKRYVAEARAKDGSLSSCAGEDVITIDQDKNIVQKHDSSDQCQGLDAFKN